MLSRRSSLSVTGNDLQPSSILSPYFDRGARRYSAAPFSLAAVLPEAESNAGKTVNTLKTDNPQRRGRSFSTPFVLPIQPPPSSYTSGVQEAHNGTLILRVGRKLSIFLPKNHESGTNGIRSLRIGMQKEVQVVSESLRRKEAKKEAPEVTLPNPEKSPRLGSNDTLSSTSRKRPRPEPILIPELPYTSATVVVTQEPTSFTAISPIKSRPATAHGLDQTSASVSKLQSVPPRSSSRGPPQGENTPSKQNSKEYALSLLQREFSAIHDPPPLPPPKSPRFLTLKTDISRNYASQNYNNNYQVEKICTSNAVSHVHARGGLLGLLCWGKGGRKRKELSGKKVPSTGRKSSLRKKTSVKRKMVPRSPTTPYYQTHSSRMMLSSTPSPQDETHTLTSAYFNGSTTRTPLASVPVLQPTSTFDPPLPSPISIISIGQSTLDIKDKKSNRLSKKAARSSTLTLSIGGKRKRKESLPSFLPSVAW